MRWLAAVVGAVAVHGAVLLLLRPLGPGPSSRPRPAPVEIVMVSRPASPPAGERPAPPPPEVEPPRRPQERSGPRAVERAQPPAAAAGRRAEAQPPAAAAGRRAEAQPPAPAVGRPSGAPDLFPRAVLERQAGAGAAGPGGRTVNAGNRAALEAAEAAAAQREAGERARRWAAEERARADTAQGRVAPVWRDIERRLALSFQPPQSVVHDEPDGKAGRLADRLGSIGRQALAMWRRGEEGLRRPVVPGSRAVEAGPGRSIDPGQQSWLGTPEGLNLRAMPLEQNQAALAALNDPARWLTVEVEVESAAGQVRAARVVVPSGRRAFDRFALEEVRRHVAAAGLPEEPTVSRWRCEAGYFVKDPSSISLTFDEMMLFDKKLREKAAVSYPLKSGVRTRVSLIFARPGP